MFESTIGIPQLRVVSWFSPHVGTHSPAAMVARAANSGASHCGLVDHGNAWGMATHVQACREHGIGAVLGVDVAVSPSHRAPAARRHRQPAPIWHPTPATPLRNNNLFHALTWGYPLRTHTSPTAAPSASLTDQRLSIDPRVALLAHGGGIHPNVGTVQNGAGWAALCSLVSTTTASAPPARSASFLAKAACRSTGAGLFTVLLGPTSEVGHAIHRQRFDLAEAVLAHWLAHMPPGCVALEAVVRPEYPRGALGSFHHAESIARLGRHCGVPVVLSCAARYPGPGFAAHATLLDAIRSGIELPATWDAPQHGASYLRTSGQMRSFAALLAKKIGDDDDGVRLISDTRAVAERCTQHPTRDLGVGALHLPDAGAVLQSTSDTDVRQVLRARALAGASRRYSGCTDAHWTQVRDRLDAEITTITRTGYTTYYLAVADICDTARTSGIRVSARGSAAGSLVCYVLGVSAVDPLTYDLLMERHLSTSRTATPDVDIDVESHRRIEVYQQVLATLGPERVAAVGMIETTQARQGVRDAGKALGLSPHDVGKLARALPHIRADSALDAVTKLPELKHVADDAKSLAVLQTAALLHNAPRHFAMHPCALALSDHTLQERVPLTVAPTTGIPLLQADKDDAEILGIAKLDILGVRMQSAISHALVQARHHPTPALKKLEISPGGALDIDQATPDDPETFTLLRSAQTVGVFQVESPGQRELLTRTQPDSFDHLLAQVALFRPGPVQADMVTPWVTTRHKVESPELLHPSLRGILDDTYGVVLYHEQVIRIIAATTGCDLAQADHIRRVMGSRHGHERARTWWWAHTRLSGEQADEVWAVLEAFGAFGFCKAHAAAFALPCYQTAWLKAHHPAALYAGLLTHDPGMYPIRVITADARRWGVSILPLDINQSGQTWQVEPWPQAPCGFGIRVPFSVVHGVSDAEVAALVAAQPFHSAADVISRARPSQPTLHALALTGAFDGMYAAREITDVKASAHHPTRRDIACFVNDLAHQSTPARQVHPAQTGALFGDKSQIPQAFPVMSPAEIVKTEIELLGFDCSQHLMNFYVPFLRELGVLPARSLGSVPPGNQVLVAGVRCVTQTPPTRSGKRVMFATLDDPTGLIDIALFDQAQHGYAHSLLSSWLILVRGHVRRTGVIGATVNATGVWNLRLLWEQWNHHGIGAVRELMRQRTVKGNGPIAHPGVARPEPHHRDWDRTSHAPDRRHVHTSPGVATPL